jgi:hypothetical protein
MSTSGPNFLQTASCAELHGFVVFTSGPKPRNALTEHGVAESAAPCRKLLHGSAMFTLGPKASLLFDQWVCVKYVNWTDWGGGGGGFCPKVCRVPRTSTFKNPFHNILSTTKLDDS